MINSVAREKEGVKTREEREVAERREVVVREVNGILMLREVSKALTTKSLPETALWEARKKQQGQRCESTYLGNT